MFNGVPGLRSQQGSSWVVGMLVLGMLVVTTRHMDGHHPWFASVAPAVSSQRGVDQFGNEEVSEVLLTQRSHL